MFQKQTRENFVLEKMRYVNYVNDKITEMHADGEDSTAHKRNLKVNVKIFYHFFLVCLHNDWEFKKKKSS